MSEVGIGRLERNRRRIVDSGRHAPLLQGLTHVFSITAVDHDDVQVPGVAFRAGRLRQSDSGNFGEELLVARRVTGAGGIPRIQVRKLCVEHCTLNAFHAGVETDFHVVVSPVLGVVT